MTATDLACFDKLYNLHLRIQQFRAFHKKQLGSLGVLFGVQNALSLYYQELL